MLSLWTACVSWGNKKAEQFLPHIEQKNRPLISHILIVTWSQFQRHQTYSSGLCVAGYYSGRVITKIMRETMVSLDAIKGIFISHPVLFLLLLYTNYQVLLSPVCVSVILLTFLHWPMFVIFPSLVLAQMIFVFNLSSVRNNEDNAS